MKTSTRLIALMALLAAGTATAATEAGTSITNQASATFDIVNPDNTTTPGTKVESNIVSTTVKAVPSFTITPNDLGTANVPDQDAPGQSTTAKPGDAVTFTYTISNTGNTPVIVQLDPRITSTNVDRTDTDVQTLEYYVGSTKLVDTNGDGLVEVPLLASVGTLGASLTVTQRYVIPTTATNGQFYGANPVGTALYDSSPSVTTPSTNVYTETVNTPGTTTQLVDNDNFNRTTVNRNDSVVVGPKDDADGNGTPTTSAYSGGTNVTVTPTATDSQLATTNALPTTITFVNAVQNTGNRTDTFELSQVSTFPTGTTVTFKDSSGNALPDVDSDGLPEITLAPGASANFQVVVTYPSGVTAVQLAGTQSVTVTATSGNSGGTASNTTTDSVQVTVNGGAFGDDTGGTAPTNTAVNNPVSIPTTCTAPVTTTFRMMVQNLGSVANTYDLSGTVTVTLKNGGTQALPVTYYSDAAATTALTDTNANTLPDTGSINPGATRTVYGVVAVPCDAAAGQYTLTQTAKGSDGTTYTDSNDIITVAVNGNFGMAKFVQGGSVTTAVNGITPVSGYGSGTGPEVAPGGTIRYVIIGKNFYNSEVRNVVLTDKLNANVTYVGASSTCAVYKDPGTPTDYSDDVLVSTKACTVNYNSTIGDVTTTAVNLASGEYVRLNLTVTVN